MFLLISNVSNRLSSLYLIFSLFYLTKYLICLLPKMYLVAQLLKNTFGCICKIIFKLMEQSNTVLFIYISIK